MTIINQENQTTTTTTAASAAQTEAGAAPAPEDNSASPADSQNLGGASNRPTTTEGTSLRVPIEPPTNEYQGSTQNVGFDQDGVRLAQEQGLDQEQGTTQNGGTTQNTGPTTGSQRDKKQAQALIQDLLEEMRSKDKKWRWAAMGLLFIAAAALAIAFTIATGGGAALVLPLATATSGATLPTLTVYGGVALGAGIIGSVLNHKEKRSAKERAKIKTIMNEVESGSNLSENNKKELRNQVDKYLNKQSLIKFDELFPTNRNEQLPAAGFVAAANSDQRSSTQAALNDSVAQANNIQDDQQVGNVSLLNCFRRNR